MLKKLILLVLLCNTAFSNCEIESEIGIKKLTDSLEEVGFNVIDIYQGIIPETPYVHRYDMNIEVDNIEKKYKAFVDVEKGVISIAEDEAFNNLEIFKTNVKEIICIE